MVHSLEVRVQDSLVPALANAVINGGIAYAGLKDSTSVPVSLDSISSSDPSVWSQGVVLAFALALILTCITAQMSKRTAAKLGTAEAGRVDRPFFPFVVGLALKNALSLFGAFVALAVLWQRIMGTVTVGPATAAVLVGLLAAVVTMVSDVWTKRALLG